MIEIHIPKKSGEVKKKGSILPWLAGLGTLAVGLWYWNKKRKEKALTQARQAQLQAQAEAERKQQTSQGQGRKSNPSIENDGFSPQVRLEAMGERPDALNNPLAREQYKQI